MRNFQYPLKDDPDQLARLEKDLIDKACAALNEAEVNSMVYGVFSIDDLETKAEKDLDGRLAVGVGYQGCAPKGSHNNPTQGNVGGINEVLFMIMFAAPSDEVCSQRYSATKIMTILRRSIAGSAVPSDERTQRCWNFVREKPEIAESTPTMLYYTQLWRIETPLIGNKEK